MTSSGGVGATETTLVAVKLGYEVGSKRILADVNVAFRPRQLTALMGCSGAGKTTLLNTLAGRSAGKRSGEILINGVPTTPEKMRLSLSYMPQDDDLYLQLTARQLLYYAALMRCPPGNGANKRSRADDIMSQLGIFQVADNLVAEISGGQKKRVSAAVEFLSTRPLLFMDEPTSGLDSATAMSLVETLRDSAREETRTVISTIHQPSWTLMCTFDSVVILGTRSGDRGGTVVYSGSPKDLPAYFGARGSPVPAGTNPADHLMYVLKEQGGDRWAERWKNSTEDDAVANEEMGSASAARKGRGDSFYIAKEDQQFPVPAFSPSSPHDGYPISYAEQYRILFLRSLHLWIYDRQQGPLILKLLFAVNVMIVLLLAGMPPNLSKAETLLFLAVTQYTMALSPLVIMMPEERAIVLREYRNGVFSAPVYWLARVTVVVLHALLVATFTTVFTYPLCGFPVAPFPSKLLHWWISQALYVSSLMILGLTIGILVPSALAGVKAIAAILIPWIATAGVTPPLSMVRPVVFYLHYPNLISWEVKLSLTIAFTNDGDKARNTLLHGVKVHPGNATSCYVALGIMFLVLFFLGLAATHSVLNKPDKVAGLRTSKKDDEIQETQGGGSGDLENAGLGNNYGAIGQTTATTTRSVPIELKEVTYRHPCSSAKKVVKKKAIDNVSVLFPAGSVSVLMGPSGAGKSTMLNLLSGRLPGGTFCNDLGEIQPCLQGDVLVDDRPVHLAAFKRLGTLTPQEDVLNEILTVRQTLVYAAELRSPGHWTHSRKLARVDAVIKELGLQHNAENVVGNSVKVGISGGQKKRLSIGVDLLAELPIMLVDEPTTGLDAASALDVVECLVSLAVDQHRTVVCTVHQPPWSTVLKFDRLVVLASGKIVYDDLPSLLPDFAAKSMRSEVPKNHNPADHVMHLLVNEQHSPCATTTEIDLKKLGTSTSSSSQYQPAAFAGNVDGSVGGHGHDDYNSYAVSEWTQFTILLRRFSYIFVVDEDQFPDVLIPGCIVTLINGLTFYNFPTNKYIGGGILYNVIAHGMICSNGIVLNIPNERLLVLREYRNGAYSIRAYWFARCTVAVWVVALMGLPWTTIWYSLVGFPARFAPIAHTYFASSLNAVVLALMAGVVGLLSRTQLAAGQVFTPIGDVQTIFAGLIITKHFIKPYMLPIFYALPISYAYEIISTAIFELKGDDGEEILAYYDLHPSNRHTDYLVLFVMVAFWLAAGFYVATLEISGEPPRLDLVSSTDNLATLWTKAEEYLAFIDHYAKHNAFWYHRGIQPHSDEGDKEEARLLSSPSITKLEREDESRRRRLAGIAAKSTASRVVSKSDSSSFLTDDAGCDD